MNNVAEKVYKRLSRTEAAKGFMGYSDDLCDALVDIINRHSHYNLKQLVNLIKSSSSYVKNLINDEKMNDDDLTMFINNNSDLRHASILLADKIYSAKEIASYIESTMKSRVKKFSGAEWDLISGDDDKAILMVQYWGEWNSGVLNKEYKDILKKIHNEYQSEYKEFKIDADIHEKCWIEFIIKRIK